MNNHFDLVVCGAGPGGLAAALRLVELSAGRWTIALFDKKEPWREPVACAEAVHRQTLINLLGEEVTGNGVVRTALDGVDFYSPNSTQVRFVRENSGLILDRALFHRTLAERCIDGGVVCDFSTRVASLSEPDRKGERTITLQSVPEGTTRQITARYVVDATGAGASLGKLKGVADGKFDLEAGAFALVKGLSHDPRYIQLHYGQKFAPGGYAWLFPRDGETVNVGVVVDRAHLKSHPPRAMLEQLLNSRWSGAEPANPQKFGGPISCGDPELPLGSGGVMRTGDAASMVNPMSRGGILEAIKGGQYAADALASLLDGSCDSFDRAAELYRQRWWEGKGRGHQQLARAKKAFASIDDHVFDRAAKRLQKVPAERRTLLRIFLETLLSSPMLIWRLRPLLR